MSSLSKTPFSSISFTSGRTFSSANWRMLSRKRISSSVKLVRGVGEGSWRTSGIQAPSHEYGEPRILASGDGVQESRRRELGLVAAEYQPKPVGLQDALDLIAGVDCPGA